MPAAQLTDALPVKILIGIVGEASCEIGKSLETNFTALDMRLELSLDEPGSEAL